MRRPLAVLLLALLVPSLAQAASGPVVEAAKRTAGATSLTFRMTVGTSVAGQRMVMTGSGVQKGANARISFRMRAQGTAFRADVILLREGGRYVLYLRSPLVRAQAPPGKSWLRLDLSRQAATAGVDLGSLFSVSQTFGPLERGLVSTTRLGREVVAGRPATRYRVLVDVRRAARALPAYREQVAALEQATGLRLGRVRYDVWIADDGRMRQVRFTMPVPGGRSVTTLTYLAFDVPVTIAAPPRAQVYTP
ncbi:MAG TPA: hypothetical protein VNJ46_10590 [Gaiellaceae bacterium]|nr:hypothetical protein [Gaiellaceae bacterium]